MKRDGVSSLWRDKVEEMLLKGPRPIEELISTAVPLVSPGIAYRCFLKAQAASRERRRLQGGVVGILPSRALDPVTSGARYVVKGGITSSVSKGAYLRDGNMISLIRRHCACPHEPKCQTQPARGHAVCQRCRVRHPLVSKAVPDNPTQAEERMEA